MKLRLFPVVAVTLAAALGLSACTAPESSENPTASSSDNLSEAKELVVVTHDSFKLPEELTKKFAAESGYEVSYVAPGDGGTLVNQLILTKDSPLGDVAYGIDNTYASRATEAGIISAYDSPALPESSSEFDTDQLTPIDFGDVCLNADTKWFEDKELPVPASFDDLLKPEYKGLLVISNPASSSPGLAFLLATIGAKETDGYLDYWGKLKDNGLKVVKGWSDAYFTEFTAGGGDGSRPLALSYATSPAFTVSEDGKTSATTALLDTCFRQIEYAGVLKGAKNEVGARKFIDFLLSEEVQASIPENMYMYPVVTDVELPEEWVKFAPLAQQPITMETSEISANRDAWIKDWTAKVIG